MENDRTAFALRNLIEYVTSGRRYESKNPYLVPEVVEGLKALLAHVGKSGVDYLDGKEVFDGEMTE